MRYKLGVWLIGSGWVAFSVVSMGFLVPELINSNSDGLLIVGYLAFVGWGLATLLVIRLVGQLLHYIKTDPKEDLKND